MFDQQKYINSYIKDNYRTIKVRIRNDDKLLINKINSVDNINEYCIDKIQQINKTLPSYQRISKIMVRDSDFERTPNMKIKRIKVKC